MGGHGGMAGGGSGSGNGGYGGMGGGYGGMGGGYGGQGGDEMCCKFKIVSDSPKERMNGVYKLVGQSWDIPRDCNSPCIYMKVNDGDNSGMDGYGYGGKGSGSGSGMGGKGSGMGGYGGYGNGVEGKGMDKKYCFRPSDYVSTECAADIEGYGAMGGYGGSAYGSGCYEYFLVVQELYI